MSARVLNDMERTIVEMVDKHGCFIMSVFDPEEAEPSFSYSIGFPQTVQQPEVIVFSLPKSLRVSMINELWRQMSEDGLQLEDGLRIANLIEGFECIARAVTNPAAIAEHFGSAIWYSRHVGSGEIKRAFQIVWPGARQGLFPWDQGCKPEVIADQPALFSSESLH